MRHAAVGLAPLVLAASGAASTPSLPTRPAAASDQIGAVIRELVAAAERNDCKTVLRLGEPLVAPGRRDLPVEIEAATLTMVAECADDVGAKQKAYDYAV